jgi:chemotaxis protein MotB
VVSNSPVGVIKGKDSRLRGDDKKRSVTTMSNLEFLNELAKELDHMHNVDQQTDDAPADVEVTADGLKVTLYDRSRRPIFEPKSAKLTQWGTFAMENLAWLIDRNKLRVVIDGHAASGMVMPDKDYGLWELTVDRANSARRAFEHYAVAPNKIERVTGYADTKPLPKVPLDSESNQRLTVSLTVE